jgi:Kdo2-lipid IVA lauroyltransferase/acyltransferase
VAPSRSVWSIRYWPTWVWLSLFRVLEALPYRLLMFIGLWIGRLISVIPTSFRRIAQVNLDLVFPDTPADERKRLLRRHFESLGMGLFETAISWWSSDGRIARLTSVEGLQNLQAAYAEGHGVLLLSAHFTVMDMGVRALGVYQKVNIMYRPTKNVVLERFLKRNRSFHTLRAIARDDIRTLVSALKQNQAVWYAPDQSYRKKGAQMVPFFGIPTGTNTATSRLARMTGARVLPMFAERLPNGGYLTRIYPALDNFPSDDPVADAERFNTLIESQARRVPEQYLWIHRRFKGMRPEDPDYYRKKKERKRTAGTVNGEQ